MRRRSLALAALLTAAGCGGDDERGGGDMGLLSDDTVPTVRTEAPPPAPPAEPPAGNARERRIGRRFPKEQDDGTVGYSFRYPSGWRVVGPDRPGIPAIITGPGASTCTASAVSRLPDWTRRANRLAYVRRRARKVRGRRAGTAGGVRAIRGANSEGATVVVETGPSTTSSAVFASAGSGVSVSCVSRGGGFDELNREVFRPLFTTVRVRREPALERAQPRVVAIEGVAGAGLARQGGGIAATVALERDRGGAHVARGVLRELARAFPEDRLFVNASKDPAKPVTGRWDPRIGGGYVQEVDKPVERFDEP